MKKVVVVIFAVVMTLGGCTTMAQHHSSTDSHSENHKQDAMPKIKELPKAAKEALAAAGITDIALITILDKNGQTFILKDKDVSFSEAVRFPISTTAIEGVTPISVVRFKGSNCIAYFWGGTSYQVCW